ncbi:MAG: c-type cytochrome [Myxococcales bacterium]|nr:c-type cytochrome [Myxococcales bacterium]
MKSSLRAPVAGALAAVLALSVGEVLAVPPFGVAPPAAECDDCAFVTLQCNACHVIPGVPAAARTDSCASCHAWVQGVSANPTAREKAMQIFPKWARYEQNVKSYFVVPELGVAAVRLDPAWVRAYLSDPYDVRPGMPETMVRLGTSPGTLEATEWIVAWFTQRSAAFPLTPRPSIENVDAGSALFASRACTACHTFGGLFLGPGLPEAPDLQHARDRMTDDALVAWIQSPSSFGSTRMPDLGLTLDEALKLRDFLVLADPGTASGSAGATNLVSTARSAVPAPRWDDVESRVFGKICVHCHMDPAQNEGRGGPGNAGGFGWPATGLELQTYGSVKANEDVILTAMRRRNGEAVRDFVKAGQKPEVIHRPALPGMPLGLPPIPPDDVAMVELWYQNGAPE